MGNSSSKKHLKLIHFYYEGVKQDLKFYPETDNLEIFKTLLILLNVSIQKDLKTILDYTIFQSDDGIPVVFDPNNWPSELSVTVVFKNMILPQQRKKFLWHNNKETEIIQESQVVYLLNEPFTKGIYRWTAQWEHPPQKKDFIGLVKYINGSQSSNNPKIFQFYHGPQCIGCGHSRSYNFNKFKQEKFHTFTFDVEKKLFIINGESQYLEEAFGLQLAVQKQTKGYLKLKWI